MQSFNLNRGVEILENTPSLLGVFLSGLSDFWINQNDDEKSWSCFDIVGHLIHGEKTDWIPRAQTIMEHGQEIVFEPFDRFAQFTESKDKSIADLLADFESLRKSNLEILKGWKLTNSDLELRGVHPEFGAVTLGQLLASWVVHDLSHVRQIMRVMSKAYRADVGPWRKYLPVLDE